MPSSQIVIISRDRRLLAMTLAAAFVIGCGGAQTEPQHSGSRLAQAGSVVKQDQPKAAPTSSAPAELPTFGETQQMVDRERTLGDLFEQASSKPFEEAPMILAADNSTTPKIDEERVAASGIRKIEGEHLTLYTDLPQAPAIEELPDVFDAAIPQWSEYFGVDAKSVESWQQIGYLMREKARFVTAGLLPESLPPFLNGFQQGNELWLYEQPSDYYRRHLLLHEGTHGFMKRFLGGAGPPWYMEGTAELFGTHRWQDQQLLLRWFPVDKELVSHWGRIKVVQDDFRSGAGKALEDVLRYDKTAHLQVEPYAWCWAAAVFFDSHPAYRDRFREFRKFAPDDTLSFSQRFYDTFKADWPSITRQWHVFVANIDYGFDIAREAIDPKEASELPNDGATVTITANRGWQSTGILLSAGTKYKLEASGRYQLGDKPKIWWCEPNGVTIRYHKGLPLGVLIGAIVDESAVDGGALPLVAPKEIGLGGEYPIDASGTLYLRVNDSPTELEDNAGSLEVRIVKVPA
ncbi:MAG: hypothetical protein H6822_10885 [Planctomycetaceae bacterium]|nr:hypothetical protein [Planctomycetales bacterium]MCB9922679.1 hypothetical protein [Planctomycetaceae bacterium]